MPTIVGRLTGAAFQTELLVMNLLGLVNSLRKWEIGWMNQVDTIRSNEHLGEINKIILSWVVKTRIIIANVYTITYLANFYSILTWCREKTLLPWLVISAFDNFLLEAIGLTITLLLWIEKSLSTALLIEYIIARAIPKVPAVYYWCIVNLFRSDLHDIQRRKLTLASLSFHQDVIRTLDTGDHFRFGGVSYSKDYFEKSPRFASLTNLNELLIHSTFDYDNEQDYYKRSKSLVTFLSIDSLESDEPEDYRTLKTFDNRSLTPMEKAIKILNINEDYINEARARLGKDVLPGPSRIEKLEKIISTVERSIADIATTRLDRNVSSIAPNRTKKYETIGKITVNEGEPSEADPSFIVVQPNVQLETETSEKEEKHRPLTKVRSFNENFLQDMSKNSTQNPLSGCICGQKTEDRMNSRNSNSRMLDEPTHEAQRNEEENDRPNGVDDMTDETRLSKGTKEKILTDINSPKFSTDSVTRSDSTDDAGRFMKWSAIDDQTNFSTVQMNLAQPLFPYQFHDEEMIWLDGYLAYPEDLERMNYELFRVDEITREPSEPWRKKTNNIVNMSSVNFQEPHNEINFDEDTEINSSNEETAQNDFAANSSVSSTPTRTKLWNCREETFKTPLRHISNANIQDSIMKSNKIFSSFSRRKKRLEKIEKREAREMRALRAYNKLTLLEDKREMEAKKQKSTLSRRVDFKTVICPSNLSNPTVGELCEVSKSKIFGKNESASDREKTDQPLKRRINARPQNQISQWTAFNVNLDALKTSISHSFSNDNKNRFRLKNIEDSLKDPPVKYNRETESQVSKQGKPIDCEVVENILSPSITGVGELRGGRDLERTQKVEKITAVGASSMDNFDRRENALERSVLASIDNVEIEIDSYAEIEARTRNNADFSRIPEAITNRGFSVNDLSLGSDDSSSHGEIVDLNSVNFLWDIVDETNTIRRLQNAFASNPENTSRGFYLGPGSTELYPVSNHFNDVVEEIMKTARLTCLGDAFRNQPTTEIDYGDSYLQEFKMTSISTFGDSSDDTLTDSDTETVDGTSDKVRHRITSDPMEMCWTSHSVESFDAISDCPNQNEEEKENVIDERDFDWDHKTWLLKNKDKENIVDCLGEQELSHLEFWTRELKNLSSDIHRNNSIEFSRHIQHLTKLPGFYVVQVIVDFFRNVIAVSRSTMTSRSVGPGNGTAVSRSDHDALATQGDEVSNIALINETAVDHQNLEFTDGNAMNSQRFYFGSPDNKRLTVAEMLNLDSEPEVHAPDIKIGAKMTYSSSVEGEIIPHSIQAYPIITKKSAACKLTDDVQKVSMNVKSVLEVHNANDGTTDVKSDSTCDSYDSLYSAAGNSNDSDNIISMDGRSSMEEFPCDTANSAVSHRAALDNATNP